MLFKMFCKENFEGFNKGEKVTMLLTNNCYFVNGIKITKDEYINNFVLV